MHARTPLLPRFVGGVYWLYSASVTRLEQQWPEFAERLAALDIDRQCQIAIRAALASLDAVGSAIPDGDELTVEAEVERLDGPGVGNPGGFGGGAA